MKFDPELFIRIAQRNGLVLTRIGNDIIVKKAPAVWLPIIKKHKRELLRFLPKDEIKNLQVDIFSDF